MQTTLDVKFNDYSQKHLDDLKLISMSDLQCIKFLGKQKLIEKLNSRLSLIQ